MRISEADARKMGALPSRIVSKGRLRVPTMNKTEERYFDLLRVRRATGELAWIRYEGVTLKLADDTRYTPDFAVMLANGELEMHETKGAFRREDSFVKLKVAAEQFPFRFYLATWTKDDGWTIEEV